MAWLPLLFTCEIFFSVFIFIFTHSKFNEIRFAGAVSVAKLPLPLSRNSLEDNLRIVTNFVRNRHGPTNQARMHSFRRNSQNTSNQPGIGVGTVTEVELPDAGVDFGPAMPELRRVGFVGPHKDAFDGQHTSGRRSATLHSHKRTHRKLTKHCAKERSAKMTTGSTSATSTVTPDVGTTIAPEGLSSGAQSTAVQATTTATSVPSPSQANSGAKVKENKEINESTATVVPSLPQPSIDAAAAMKPLTEPQTKSAPPAQTVQQPPSQPFFPPIFPPSAPFVPPPQPAPMPGPAFPSFPAPLLPQPMGPPSGGVLPQPKSTKSNLIVGGSKMSNFKLIYFDARGLCEPIRLLFHYAKVPFEDSRISRKQWLAYKDSTVFGKVPILEVDGKPLTYCHTISRYLARTFGLAGEDSWEEAKVDEVADFHADVANDLQPYMYVVAGFHQGDKNALRSAIFLPGVEKNFPVYVQLLKQSGSGFFMASGVTWVDLVIAEYMTTVKHFEPQILDKYPALNKFIHKIQTLPQIIEYITNREHQPVMVR